MKRWIALASVIIGVVLVLITNAAGVGIPVLDVENLMQNVLSYAQHVITATNSSTQVVNQATQIAYQARNALPLNVSLSDPAFTEFHKVNSTFSAIAGLGHSLTSLTQRYNCPVWPGHQPVAATAQGHGLATGCRPYGGKPECHHRPGGDCRKRKRGDIGTADDHG